MYFGKIAISDIVFPAANFAARPVVEPTDLKLWPIIEELAESIAKQGLGNIPTFRVEGDKFCVVDGSRRARALKLLCETNDPKYAEIKALAFERYPDWQIEVPITEMDDYTALGNQIAGNFHVSKQPKASLAKAVYKLMVGGGKTIGEISKSCGISEAVLTEMLKLNTLPEAAQKAVDAGTMSLANAYQLCKLPIDAMDDEVIAAAMSAKGSEFAAAIGEKINEIRKNNKIALGETGERKKEFAPTAKLRSKEDLNALLTQAEYSYSEQATDYAKGRLDAFQEIFMLDEVSIAAAKSAWEKAQAEAEEKKARAAKTEAARKEEAIKYLKEQGITSLEQLEGAPVTLMSSLLNNSLSK